MTSSSEQEPGSQQAPGYFEEALGILKLRAKSQGLIIDHDATEALRDKLGTAIAIVKRVEGPGIFSREHQAVFTTTANLLAKVATDAAQIDQAQYVNHLHIDTAVQRLELLGIWPFTED